MTFLTATFDQIKSALRLMVPPAVMIVLLVLNVSALPYPLSFIARTPLVLMAVYYWSIYRPTLVPPWFAFTLGILLDVLSQSPLGLNALMFVVVQWLVSDQRRYLMAQNFLMIWIGFALISFGIAFLQWLIVSLVHQALPPLQDVVLHSILGLAFFPFVNLLLHLSHKALPDADRPYDVKIRQR